MVTAGSQPAAPRPGRAGGRAAGTGAAPLGRPRRHGVVAARSAAVMTGVLVLTAVVVTAAIAASTAAAVLVALAGAAVAVAARARVRALAHRHTHTQRAAAEDLLAAFAEELEAGAPPPAALRSAAVSTSGAPTGLATAADPAVALAASDVPAVRQLAAGWKVSNRSGIRLAALAARLSASARAAGARDRELRAALAGPRASGRLVAGLPVIAAGLGASLGASPHLVLLDTGAGLACLVAGLLCDLAGLGWMNRIVDRVERRCDGSLALQGAASAARGDGPRGRGRRGAGASFAGVLAIRRGPTRAMAALGAATVAAPTALAGAGFRELAVPVLGAGVAGLAGAAFAAMRSDPARLHHAQLLADIPIALDLAAACLAAGAAPQLAVRAVGEAVAGPLGTELVNAAGALRSGSRPREAFCRLLDLSRPPAPIATLSERVPRRVGAPAPAVVALVEALERSEVSGARLAATLERAADRSRDEAHAAAIEAARRAGVTAAAPLGLCFLPAFLLLGVGPVLLAAAPGLVGG